MSFEEKLRLTDWWQPLQAKLPADYWQRAEQFIAEQAAKNPIYPAPDHILNALLTTPLAQVKVVIVGQDPYHQPFQAQGLSFSVPNSVKRPPSLVNIFKELTQDLGVAEPTTNDLTPWARQGVLLLNSVLTVPDSQPNAHANKGWEVLTDAVLAVVSEQAAPSVFILWGKFAQSKARLVDEQRHLILKSVHPSPLSAYRGFFGSAPFSKANQYLAARGREQIDWRLD